MLTIDGLKPCPVCGSEGIVKLFHIYNDGFARDCHVKVDGVDYTAECMKRDCRVRTEHYSLIEEATNAWNRGKVKAK